MNQVERLAEKLLQERAALAQRVKHRPRPEQPVGADFDPFETTKYKVIAGTDPGYLPQTPMRRGHGGFFVACRACGQQFESKSMAYCTTCLDLPAEERRTMKPAATGRLCQAPGCENFIPRKARADTRYCSQSCQQKAKRSRRDRDNP